MTYRNNSSSSLEIDSLLSDMKNVKLRIEDVYTKTEIQEFLALDAINDADSYYTKEATIMLLDGKVSNESLTTNYYNKTSTDTLLNESVEIDRCGACASNMDGQDGGWSARA